MVRHKVNGSWREVRSTPDCHGRYQIIALWKDGKRKTFMLHNLVSEAFGIPVEDVKRKLYQGFRLDPEAKTRVRSPVFKRIPDDRIRGGREMKNAYYRDLLLAYQRKAKRILSLPTPEQQAACFAADCKGHPEQTALLLSALAQIDADTVSLKEGKETV